ncbi:helix-turn-helix domain-containing protein [Micromonospora sp. WMMA1996]|uniref:helix-turn-helix domain-containing protein n=1 Tax=Micromonospora sp. WMMA1996 TaxID=2039878 RepID=UPI00159B9A58|nr:helix-turn-helix domain-containing protein [Micromonospora sp. WMMA1996]
MPVYWDSLTISDLAFNLGVEEEVVKGELTDIGIPFKSSVTRVEPAVARRVRASLRQKGVIAAADLSDLRRPGNRTSDSADSARIAFGQALRTLRKKEGVSLRSVAQQARYSPSSISAAETGASLPKWDLVERFVRLCNGDIEHFRKLYQEVLLAEESRRRPSASSSGFVSIQVPAQYEALISIFQECVPANVLDAVGSMWGAMRESEYRTCLVLTRWAVEVVCVDKGINGDSAPSAGLAFLNGRKLINDDLMRWGKSILQLTNKVAHTNYATTYSDAESAIRFTVALLSQVYLIGDQIESFKKSRDNS